MGVYMVNIFIHVTFQFNQILGIDPKYFKIFNVSKEFAGFSRVCDLDDRVFFQRHVLTRTQTKGFV